MLITILKPNFKHSDDRGLIVQLVREGYRQVNVVESKAGTIRGGHCHRLNREVFFVVIGEFRFVAERDGETEVHTFKAGDMFLVPPLVIHSFDYTQDTILVGLYDMGVEIANGEKDIYAASTGRV